VIDNLISEDITNHVCSDPLEHCLLDDGTSQGVNFDFTMCAHFFEASPQVSPYPS